jgi:excisionase family DNA binding protein
MENRLALGLKESAEAVGLSHWTIRKFIREGTLRSVRLGKRVLVEPGELQKLLERGRIGGERNGNNIQNLGA